MQLQAGKATGLLELFENELSINRDLESLAAGLVGRKAEIDGPFGRKPLVYADYVASGRALMQVEQFVLENVLPFYANSHTEASYCGGMMTRLRREARARIAAICGADQKHAVIFAGSGATAGINRLVSLLGANERTRVLIGPYEHHSNILPWRESGADVVELPEGKGGGPDCVALAAALADSANFERVICSFSAASNVTGIVTDIQNVTRMVKAAGAIMIWDYAGGGPYLPIRMSAAANAEIDAIVVSPHKFIGGPGASGVLIVRRDCVQRSTPTWAGGGTVRFVSSSGHDYAESLEAREEAGTPNVVGDIRAALVFIVKEVIGEERMAARNHELVQRALAAWQNEPKIQLLGRLDVPRLPIFSFRLRDEEGGFVHQQLATRMLSDRFGIQARGGCACAGPYVHHLLEISEEESARLRNAILAGQEMEKPGFVRLNLSVLMDDEKVAYILDSVRELARDAPQFMDAYGFDPSRAIFFPKAA